MIRDRQLSGGESPAAVQMVTPLAPCLPVMVWENGRGIERCSTLERGPDWGASASGVDTAAVSLRRSARRDRWLGESGVCDAF